MALQTLYVLLAVVAATFGVYMIYFRDNRKAMMNAEILGTASKSNRPFHEILENKALLDFPHDAVILSYEKVNRNNLVVKNGRKGYFSPSDQYELFTIDRELKKLDESGLSGTKYLVRSTLNDPKPIVLTHWFKSIAGNSDIGFNAYLNIKDRDYHLPELSLKEYDTVVTLVKKSLETGGFTHLIIGSTGWNNLPASSLSTYKNWLSKTIDASREDNLVFKPFFIGITWPSSWITPVLSIFNKANDADEIGMTHLNYLIWEKLLPVIKKLPIKIPVVTLSHSFGARLMSRACHSRFMLDSAPKETYVDLSIDLQGAYPVTRFCEKQGNNGGLYVPDNPVKLHVVTSSKYDLANKYAFWSVSYIGSSKSISVLRDSVAANDFEFCSIDGNGRLVGFQGITSKISVDAKKIINKPKVSFAGAHSDIEDKEAGRFIWELIKQLK